MAHANELISHRNVLRLRGWVELSVHWLENTCCVALSLFTPPPVSPTTSAVSAAAPPPAPSVDVFVSPHSV